MPVERTVYEFVDIGGERVVKLFDAQAASMLRADAAAKKYFATMTRGSSAVAGSAAGMTALATAIRGLDTRLLSLDNRLLRIDRRLAVTNGRLIGMGRAVTPARAGLRGMATDTSRLRSEMLLLDAATAGLNGRFSLRGGILTGGAAGVAGAALFGASLIAGEQSYIRAQRAAGLFNDTQLEINDTVNQFRGIAIRTYQPLEQVTKRYQRLGLIQEQLGATTGQSLAILEAVANAERLQGGSTRSTQAGVDQLVQGLTSGIFGGDELRSVRENLPQLAEAIARGLSQLRGETITVGDLRNQNGISSRELAQALLIANEDLGRRAADLDPTLAEQFRQTLASLQLFNQELGRLVGASDGLVFVLGRFAESAIIATAGVQAVANNEVLPLEVSAAATTVLRIFQGGGRFGSGESPNSIFQEALQDLQSEQESSFEQRLIQLQEIIAGLDRPFANTQLAELPLERQLELAQRAVAQPDRDLFRALNFARFQSQALRNGSSLEDVRREAREIQIRARENDLVIQIRHNLEQQGVQERVINEVLEKRAEAVDELIAAQNELEQLRKQSFFDEQVDKRNDRLRDEIELRHETIGLSRSEAASREAVLNLEIAAREAGVELTLTQREETRELIRLQEQQAQLAEDSRDFARAGTDFFRDLESGVVTVEDAVSRLANRFADLLVEIFVFRQLENFLTGAFFGTGNLLGAGPSLAANGGVFSPRYMADGGFTQSPTYFPSLNVVTSEHNQEEAVVPLSREDFGRQPNGKLGLRQRDRNGGAGVIPAAIVTEQSLRRGVKAEDVMRTLEREIAKSGSRLNRAVSSVRGRN